jgi:hypothetical protein
MPLAPLGVGDFTALGEAVGGGLLQLAKTRKRGTHQRFTLM